MSDIAEMQKQADEAFCSSCGAIIKKEAEICPKCGVRQKVAVDPTKDRSMVAALLLLIFLGSGIHRFYLGKAGTGILMLLLAIPAWIGFVAPIAWIFAIPYFIWWVVDLVRIITKSISPRLK
jgi:TM2 domain-containing membrane protein YozV